MLCGGITTFWCQIRVETSHFIVFCFLPVLCFSFCMLMDTFASFSHWFDENHKYCCRGKWTVKVQLGRFPISHCGACGSFWLCRWYGSISAVSLGPFIAPGQQQLVGGPMQGAGLPLILVSCQPIRGSWDSCLAEFLEVRNGRSGLSVFEASFAWQPCFKLLFSCLEVWCRGDERGFFLIRRSCSSRLCTPTLRTEVWTVCAGDGLGPWGWRRLCSESRGIKVILTVFRTLCRCCTIRRGWSWSGFSPQCSSRSCQGFCVTSQTCSTSWGSTAVVGPSWSALAGQCPSKFRNVVDTKVPEISHPFHLKLLDILWRALSSCAYTFPWSSGLMEHFLSCAAA